MLGAWIRDIQGFASKIVAVLDELVEENYSAALTPKELGERTHLSEAELHKGLALLLGGGWVERTRQSFDGYYIRLTSFGKEQFDLQTHVRKNADLRKLMLAKLASVYEKQIYNWTSSEELEEITDATANLVCLNLRILERGGWLEMKGYIGTGGPAANVRLTDRGKAMYDNPPSRLLFISHAAVDRQIAARLREAIEYSFPAIDVFVSSAPDSLKAGDPWVQKILNALERANAAIILATERGLGRKWVWFEGGATWAKKILTIPGCLGRQRKGSLPAPFMLSQAENLDDAEDLKAVFVVLEEVFGKVEAEPDYAMLAAELKQLDVSAQSAFEQETVPYSAERRKMVADKLAKINPIQKEAMRILMVQGEVSDHYAINAIHQKGISTNSIVSVYPGLELETGFVQQVPGSGDGRQNWNVRYRINPDLRPLLEEFLFTPHCV